LKARGCRRPVFKLFRKSVASAAISSKSIQTKYMPSSKIRSLIIRALAPLRWAVRFELQRHKDIDLQDIPGQLQREALAETAAYVKQHMLRVDSVDCPLKVLTFALGQVQHKDGLYLEFGVFSGRTINHAAGQIAGRIYGFDSFEGLPERWRDGLGAGHFKVNTLPAVKSNVTLIKGWFDQTLPEFLKEHPGDAAFIHVDCDLYSSTKIIFDCLASRIKPGTIMVFDEYFNYPGWQEDEHKALQEFVARTGMSYEYLCYHRNSQQVCIRML